MRISKELVSNISLVCISIILIGLFYVSSLGCSCDENSQNDNSETQVPDIDDGAAEAPPPVPNHACVGRAKQTYVNVTFDVQRDGAKWVHSCDWSVTACGGEVMYWVSLENDTRQIPMTPGNQYVAENKSDSSSGEQSGYALLNRCYIYFVNAPVGEVPDLAVYFYPDTNTTSTERLDTSTGYKGPPCEDEAECRDIYNKPSSAYNCIQGQCYYACDEQADCVTAPDYDGTYFCTKGKSDKYDASCVKYRQLELTCTDDTDCQERFPSGVLTTCLDGGCVKPCTDDSECYPSLGLYCLPSGESKYCLPLDETETTCRLPGNLCVTASTTTASVGDTVTFTVRSEGADCEGRIPQVDVHRSCTIDGSQKTDIYTLSPEPFSGGTSTAEWTVTDGTNCPGEDYQVFARLYQGNEFCSGESFIEVD